jgi:hypothetical protein
VDRVLRWRPLVSSVAPSDLMVVAVDCIGNDGVGANSVGMIGGVRMFGGADYTGTDGFDVATDSVTGWFLIPNRDA